MTFCSPHTLSTFSFAVVLCIFLMLSSLSVMAYETDYFYLDDTRITSNWTWQKGGPNFLCGLHNGSAVRITSQEVQADVEAFVATLRLTFMKNAYLGAELRPHESLGWYWISDANKNDLIDHVKTSQNASVHDTALMETLYWSNGSSVGFTQWEESGLPPVTEEYATRRGVAYNITSGKWFTAHANQDYAVLCKRNEANDASAHESHEDKMIKWYLGINIIGWILFAVVAFVVLPLFFCCCWCRGNKKTASSLSSSSSSKLLSSSSFSFAAMTADAKQPSSGPLPSVRNPLQLPPSLSLASPSSSSSQNNTNNNTKHSNKHNKEEKNKSDVSKNNRYGDVDDTSLLQRQVSKKRMSNW